MGHRIWPHHSSGSSRPDNPLESVQCQRGRGDSGKRPRDGIGSRAFARLRRPLPGRDSGAFEPGQWRLPDCGYGGRSAIALGGKAHGPAITVCIFGDAPQIDAAWPDCPWERSFPRRRSKLLRTMKTNAKKWARSFPRGLTQAKRKWAAQTACCLIHCGTRTQAGTASGVVEDGGRPADTAA